MSPGPNNLLNMSQQTKTSSGLPYPVILVVGLAAMFGGFWFSKNVKVELLEKLAEQGLPIDFGKTIAVVGVMLIMFPVVKMFYLQPLADAIESRNAELEKTFSEAEDLRTEMTRMKGDYERRLASTEAAAREQIQKEIAEARKFADEKVAAVNGAIDEMKAKAVEDIERQKQAALTELRVMVTNLTLTATERVLKANVDTDKNRKLIDDFISEVEVPA